MNKTFIISVIGLFSLLIFNLTVIVKKDIEDTKREELNQKIENSIIHRNHIYNTKEYNSITPRREKTMEQQLVTQKPLFS